jgi:enoyl-CoA hydratase/carnithine racemase
MTDSQHVLVETNAGVRTITLNRPEKKNAFTIAMYAQCVAALQDAAKDDAVRVVLFTGNGSSFTAGNDLFDFMNNPPTGEDSPVMQFLYTLIDYDKPVVVAVEGNAVGIGVTMLLHCDLVYASETARFTTPFVSLGLVPEGASSFLLPRIAGHAKAAEFLLLAEPVDAKTAGEMGVVTRVIAPGELLAFARAKAQRLAELPPGSVREAKRLMRAPLREKIKQVVAEEAVQFAMKLGSPEAMEAFQAFFEKRKPDFSKVS